MIQATRGAGTHPAWTRCTEHTCLLQHRHLSTAFTHRSSAAYSSLPSLLTHAGRWVCTSVLTACIKPAGEGAVAFPCSAMHTEQCVPNTHMQVPAQACRSAYTKIYVPIAINMHICRFMPALPTPFMHGLCMDTYTGMLRGSVQANA